MDMVYLLWLRISARFLYKGGHGWMDPYKLLITGQIPLVGETYVSGGKNTSVAVIPATLLSDEPCTIENLPDIEDVHVLKDILTDLGAQVDYQPENKRMTVDPRNVNTYLVPYRQSQRMRASYYLRGLLHRGAACGPAHQGIPRHGRAGGGKRRGDHRPGQNEGHPRVF